MSFWDKYHVVMRWDPNALTMDSPQGNWITIGRFVDALGASECVARAEAMDRRLGRQYAYKVCWPADKFACEI